MQRLSLGLILLLGAVAVFDTAAAQDDEKLYQKLFKPIKNFATRKCDPNFGKGTLCERCKNKRGNKLCARCVEKAKETAAKEIEKKELCLELEKLALDKKKLEEEKKDFEKAIEEKYKPWDVADPENLESPDPLLKMAAAAKQDQELAPKKIKALQYISAIGCSKVADAGKIILEGLTDGNVNVRAAAVQAILSPYLSPYGTYGDYIPGMDGHSDDMQNGAGGNGAGANGAGANGMPGGGQMMMASCHAPGCSPSQGRGFRNRTKRSTCGRCSGKGCDFCKFQGHVDKIIAQICEDCPRKPEPVDCCEACQGRGFRQRLKARRCSGCQGNGCGACNYQGQITHVEEVPCACQMKPANQVGMGLDLCQSQDSCQACCTKEVKEELEKMAFEITNECYYEPNEIVRNLAAQALELCPKEKKVEIEGIENDDPDRRRIEGLDEERPQPEEELSGFDEITSARANFNDRTPTNTSRRNGADRGSRTHALAVVESFQPNDRVAVRLEGAYLIPRFSMLEIETRSGSRHECIVTDSEVGRLTVQRTDGDQINVQSGESLRFGVLSVEGQPRQLY